MGKIDFVKQQHPGDDGSPSGKHPFEVEYTNPDADAKAAITQAEDQKKKFSWFGLRRSQDQVMNISMPPATPTPTPTPSPRPVAPKPLPVPAPPVPMAIPAAPLPKPIPPQPKPAPIQTPPPTPPAQPVASKPILAAQVPPAAPVFVAPGAPAKAAAPSHAQKRIDADEVVTRNVSHVHGELTNPVPVPSSDFMVNLLPSDLFNAMNPMVRIAGLVKIALIMVVCIGMVYGVILAYQSYYLWQTRTNQLEIERVDREIANYSDLQTNLTQTSKTLNDVSTILGQHVYWSNVLVLLEQYTLPNVYFSSLSASTTGGISVQAITSDFSSVTKQVETLRQAHLASNPSALVFSDVHVDTVTRNAITEKNDTNTNSNSNTNTSASNVTAFSLSFKVDPTFLNYQTLYEFQH